MEQHILHQIKELGIEDLAIAARHHIHQNPDLSEHEEGTRDYIASELQKLGIPYESGIADTGLVATITGARSHPVIALRADMDALPIQEENPELDFRSCREGVMHACGHDIHAAVLLGVGAYFQSMRETLPGTVKLLFQPAEESIGGAQRMIDEGCLDDPRVDAVLGLHVEPSLPVGSVGIKYGKMYACSDEINVDIYGTSSHGARPDLGSDAVYMASAIIQNVQAIISRNISPTNSAVCTFGTIHGGNIRNQVADHVELTGMIRALDEDTREFLRDRITLVCDSVTAMMGGQAVVHFRPSYSPLINNDTIVGTIREAASDLLGADSVLVEDTPQLTVEDFSYFAEARPSCFWHLGCTSPEDDSLQILHNAGFHPEDACIPIGIAVQASAALKLMKTL